MNKEKSELSAALGKACYYDSNYYCMYYDISY